MKSATTKTRTKANSRAPNRSKRATEEPSARSLRAVPEVDFARARAVKGRGRYAGAIRSAGGSWAVPDGMAALWMADVRKGCAAGPPSEVSLSEMRDVIAQFGGYFVVDASGGKVERTWVPVSPGRPRKGAASTLSRTRTVRLPEPVWTLLERLAKRQHTTVNALLGEAVARLVHPPTTALGKR